MRKNMAIAMVVAAAIAISGVASSPAARADDIQSITAKLKPNKLPKKRFRPAQIYVEILTGPNTGDPNYPEQPPSAFKTKVSFPSNMRFSTKKVPKCAGSEAQLQNTTTKQAIRVCKRKSIVSKGGGVPKRAGHSKGTSAWVIVDLGATTLDVPVQVTAFNGTRKNELFLHARADSVNNTSILVGKIRKGPRGYGKTLNVRVPPLLAGAISRFTTTVQNGKYVKARCKRKRMKFLAVSRYTNHATTSDTFVQRCKRRGHHKHHKR